MLFCQRNPQACPLIEVCDVGIPHPTESLAIGADIRTDIPKYSIHKEGVLEKVVTDVVKEWPEDSAAFLVNCSFTYDSELLQATILL